MFKRHRFFTFLIRDEIERGPKHACGRRRKLPFEVQFTTQYFYALPRRRRAPGARYQDSSHEIAVDLLLSCWMVLSSVPPETNRTSITWVEA
ncbi:hypothetical protein HYPSUDRAFT_439397 [Hypholoma sublateritium FD-334 SS-4]|uniref:Uncharacterized protein n=1 Tax=Hypholoma sublateritium (strain FD-334 SS-4) TaxID=945553 RepID=A0A0D2P982_HYPSF|nr:hypothetical protein HYPSUDRAFT_439397 [Hypholoma sublateritium FD-334 SS-4]